MQFSHPGNNRLAGIFTYCHAKAWIFACNLLQALGEFAFIGLGFWFNGYPYNRLGKIHRLQYDEITNSTKSVASTRKFKSDNRTDITSADTGDLLALIGMQFKQL